MRLLDSGVSDMLTNDSGPVQKGVVRPSKCIGNIRIHSCIPDIFVMIPTSPQKY